METEVVGVIRYQDSVPAYARYPVSLTTSPRGRRGENDNHIQRTDKNICPTAPYSIHDLTEERGLVGIDIFCPCLWLWFL